MNNHRCLFCGRKLNSDLEDRYHRHYFCIKKFFNVSVFPDISFLESNLETLAIDELRNHLSITGVQKKISCSVKRDEKTKRLFLILKILNLLSKRLIKKSQILLKMSIL